MNCLLLAVNNPTKLNKLKLKLVRFASTAIAQLNSCIFSHSDDEQSTSSFNTSLNVQCKPSKVVQVLESLRREPKIAFSFFCELEERGFQHNISTYAALIRILCSWGLGRKLETLFLNLIGSKKVEFDVLDLIESLNQGCVVDASFIRVYDALIKAYVSVNLFDSVVDLLFRLGRKGFVPHIFTCNYLLNRLIEHGKMNMALVVYEQLKRFGCQPNDYTYATVIKGLCKIGKMEKAIDIFEEMSGYGMVPNAFACAAYIEALCTHDCSTSGYQLLQAWRAELFPIDTYAYTVVIRGFCDEMKIDEAESVFLDMENYGVVPDAQTYGVLINGYCKKLNLQKALSLHSLMLSKGIKSNCVIVSFILQCFLRMQMYSEVVNQFKVFQGKGVFLDNVVYNIVVHALCELGKLEEAIELLEEMTSRQIQMDVMHYTTMIKGLFAQGKIHEAMMMFENLKKNGVEPDSITYSVLAAGFSRNGLVSKVQDLLDYMEEHGLRKDPKMPDLIIENLCIGGKVKEATEIFNSLEVKTVDNYAAMINGYCAASDTKSAYKLFVNLSKEGIFIRRSSLVRLVSRLCMENSSFRAIEVMKQLPVMNVEAKEIVYNKVIASLCRVKNMKMAQCLFDCLVRAGLIPDLITYTMMINGYCKINYLREAYELLCDMRNRGREPDIFVYTVLLDGGFKTSLQKCSSVEIALTSSIFNEMKDMKITPDVVYYTVLIDGYCKMNNLNDAFVLFEEMVDQGIEADAVTYTALLSSCCRNGYKEKAQTLCYEMTSKGILPPNNFSYLLQHDTLETKKI
ncbi:pentatricopeptide repeat-containing protein At2g26790, mitochondrial [Cucumis sativus]|nr:pentatricopeptide repeat-containing protein At2g26790, mitochondrial [Cucumis sativus]XP_011655792.1 pentatricopeptide repeat-containing protein At2g26790, mitochondrial [Cucumis sativus]XP_031736179.1 pentatricopeptide repeat-containing protein At2g26790, mitochondrial [Cucumis sativus]XP_031736180.1 pentatricopeptide repeat-containing protein At2g26790, mitochondrial [Cucumis sativus]XP_031736181.1 pentatricopeptide repeat-containing protein At2g26790, mitochondrial [Cucumis sativus]XP_03